MTDKEYSDEELYIDGMGEEDGEITDLGSITPANDPKFADEDLMIDGMESPSGNLDFLTPSPSQESSPTLYGDALNILKNSDIPFLSPMASGLDSVLPTGDTVGEFLPDATGAIGGALGGAAALNPASLVSSMGSSSLVAPAAIATGSTIGRHFGDQVGKVLGIRDPDINAYQSDASTGRTGQLISGAADVALPFAGKAVSLLGSAASSLRRKLFTTAVDFSEAMAKGRGTEAIASIPKKAFGRLSVDLGGTEDAAKLVSNVIKDAEKGFKSAKVPKSEWGVAFQGLVDEAGQRVSKVVEEAEALLPQKDYTPGVLRKIQETANALGLEDASPKNANKIIKALRDDVDFQKLVRGGKADGLDRVQTALVQEVMQTLSTREGLTPTAMLALKTEYDDLVFKAAKGGLDEEVTVKAFDRLRYLYRKQIERATADASPELLSAFQKANKEYYPYALLGREELEVAGGIARDKAVQMATPPSIASSVSGIGLNAASAGRQAYDGYQEESFTPQFMPPPTMQSMGEDGKVTDPVDVKAGLAQAEDVLKKDPVQRAEVKKALIKAQALPPSYINQIGGQAPEEIDEKTEYLRDKEGALKQPYVLKNEGVTLSTGLYLGDKDEDSMREMGVSEKLITKIRPLLGETSEKRAKNLVSQRRTKLTDSELRELEKASIEYHSKVAEKDFENLTGGDKLDDLPTPAKLTLYSLAYHNGSLRGKETIKDIAKNMSTGNYQRAYNQLLKIHKSSNKKFGDRYLREAKNIEPLIANTTYAQYDSTDKATSTTVMPDGKVKTNYS